MRDVVFQQFFAVGLTVYSFFIELVDHLDCQLFVSFRYLSVSLYRFKLDDVGQI